MKTKFYLLILIIGGIISIIPFAFYWTDRGLADWQVKLTQTKETKTEPVETTLLFGGDVMLARTVEQKMIKNADWTLPFLEIAEQFSQADISFINLESPFLDGGNSTPVDSLVFRALPDSIEGLVLAGIDVVTLANNHFANQGTAGMKQTMELLNDRDIAYCGAGQNSQQSHQAVIIERNGLKFAYLGYAYPDSNLATATKMGVNNMNLEQMTADVQEAAQMADLVIVSMHAGAEYVYTPNQKQVDFARAAVSAGADLIIGHHPHVVQTYEQYQEGHIFYSLGNLVFDQDWSEPTTEGVVAKVILENQKIKTIEFLPIKTIDYHQATWGNEETAQHVLDRLQLDSLVIIPN